MTSTHGRISELALKVTSGTLFGTAIAAAILRTVLRVHYKKALALEDVFLLLACIFLTVSVILLYLGVDIMFLEEQLTLDPFSVSFTPNLLPDIWWFQKIIYSSLDLSMAAVYCVKFSFLCFFRQLIDRLPGMVLYWKVVIGVCALVFAGSMTSPFVGCPYFDMMSGACLNDEFYTRSLVVSVLFSSLDIVTDAMIIAIPARILWEVTIRRRQKMVLGLTLSLSIFMVITCVIQMSGLSLTGSIEALGSSGKSIDTVWQVFWQHIEACVAVAMVSLSSFRSLFNAHVQSSRERRAAHWSKSSSGARIPVRMESCSKGSSNKLSTPPALVLAMRRSLYEPITMDSSDGIAFAPRREMIPDPVPLAQLRQPGSLRDVEEDSSEDLKWPHERC